MNKNNKEYGNFVIDTITNKHNKDMQFHLSKTRNEIEQMKIELTSDNGSSSFRHNELSARKKMLNRENNLNKLKEAHAGGMTLQKHLFMITVTYERSCLCVGSNVNNHIHKINGNFENLYYKIAHDLIGGNISRRLELQPFCWVFIDGAATRSGGTFHSSRVGENTHHHGILLIHPSNLEKFNSLTNKRKIKEWQDSSFNVTNIKIEPISQLSEAHIVIDYSMKLEVQLMTKNEIYSEVDFIMPRAEVLKLKKLVGLKPT